VSDPSHAAQGDPAKRAVDEVGDNTLIGPGFRFVVSNSACRGIKAPPDGGIIMACTYIDDVTYCASSPDLAQRFFSEMRESFVIEEGEGKQVDFLLGITVTQNLIAGTIRLDIAMAITKLCSAVLTEEELDASTAFAQEHGAHCTHCCY